MFRTYCFLALLSALFCTAAEPLKAVDEPKQIRTLAGMIKPGGVTGGNDEALQQKYFAIIYRMRDTWLDIGLRPAEQVERACALAKTSPTRALLLRGALVEAYDEADSIGLFDPGTLGELGNFATNGGSRPKVPKGPDAGKRAKMMPYLAGPENKAFAGDFANYRLGVEGETLSPDSAEAYARIGQNRKLMMTQAAEQEGVVKEEKKEFETEFKNALAASGNQTADKSSINVKGQIMEAANNGNNETVRLEGAITNSSAFPLAAKVEWMFIGRSPEKKRMVNLGSKTDDLKILPKDWKKLDARSISITSGTAKARAGGLDGSNPKKWVAPRYLGWIIRVTDAQDKTLAFRTSGLGELDQLAESGAGLSSLRSQTATK